jgi:hypothetical protein
LADEYPQHLFTALAGLAEAGKPMERQTYGTIDAQRN